MRKISKLLSFKLSELQIDDMIWQVYFEKSKAVKSHNLSKLILKMVKKVKIILVILDPREYTWFGSHTNHTP